MQRDTQLKLKAELLAGHPVTGPYNVDDQLAYDEITAKNIQRYKKVDYSDVASYLRLVDKWYTLNTSTDPAAKSFILDMNTFKSFDLGKVVPTGVPTVLATVTTALDNLITAGIINATDKTIILSLGNDPISRAEELGITFEGVFDITNARNV